MTPGEEMKGLPPVRHKDLPVMPDDIASGDVAFGPETSPPASGPLVDQFGRRVRRMRVSVTDHCNLRCTYCMPEDVRFLPTSEFLTFDEIERVVRIAAAMGVDKIRLTGGEPLLRPDIADLVARLKAVPGVTTVSMTTNGIGLTEQATKLKTAGLDGINISLDSLDPERFRQIARRGGLERVLAGIEAAEASGIEPVKLNCVVMRGINDEDVVPLLRRALERPGHIRFIEFMPLDADNIWERNLVFTKAEILSLAETVAPFQPVGNNPADPARLYRFEKGKGLFGVIASVSEPFCGTCDRIRLTAEGRLRNCLFALEEHDLRGLLREKADDEAIGAAIRAAVWDKWAGHLIDMPQFVKPDRTMHAIGG